MSKCDSLLNNVECEYKYSVNPAYTDSFIADFCRVFNEEVAHRYEHLSDKFKQAHPLTEFQADESDCVTETLQNQYFDTADDLIFKKFMAGLRLRRSDKSDGVEQTVKYKSEDAANGAAHTHVEYNVMVHQEPPLEIPDLTLFAPGQLPDEMIALARDHQLISHYQTDFTRKKMVFKVPHFLSFELALDLGNIVAGGTEAPICEVEFELKELDRDYVESNWGRFIYDLADIRFDFSTFINELLLKISGAPTCFEDSSHLLGEHHDRDPKSACAVFGLHHSSDYNTMGTCDICGDKVSSCDSSAHGSADKGDSHCDQVSRGGLDGKGYDESLASLHKEDFGFDDDNSVLAQKLEKMNAARTEPKAGGVIGLEPLSKLRRAVLLRQFDQDNQEHAEGAPYILSVERGTRIDLAYYLKVMSDYDQLEDSYISNFHDVCTKISEGYTLAVGLANLFGCREHFEDLRDFLKQALRFACSRKRFIVSDHMKNSHRKMCEDPELNELSMLVINDCSSMYVEFNVNMWMVPFYGKLAAALERPNFTLDDFQELTRTVADNSFAIKSSEYIERLLYIIARKSVLFAHDADTREDYKHIALATQHHMRQAWSGIKISGSL